MVTSEYQSNQDLQETFDPENANSKLKQDLARLNINLKSDSREKILAIL